MISCMVQNPLPPIMRSIFLVFILWTVIVQSCDTVEEFCQRNPGSCISLNNRCIEDCARLTEDEEASIKFMPTSEYDAFPNESIYVINSDIPIMDDPGDDLSYYNSEFWKLMDGYDILDETAEEFNPAYDTTGISLPREDVNSRARRASSKNSHYSTGIMPSNRVGEVRYHALPITSYRRGNLVPYTKNYSKSLIPITTVSPTITTPPPSLRPPPKDPQPSVCVWSSLPQVEFEVDGKLYDKYCQPVCQTHGQFFPHLTDCTKFYQCSHGKPAVLGCAANLVFDTIINTCNYVYQAKNDACKAKTACPNN